jgi:hypothetical protein
VGKGGTSIVMHANNNAAFITGSSAAQNRYTASVDGGIYSIFDTLDGDFGRGNSYYYNIKFLNISASVTSSNYTNSYPTYSVPQTSNMGFTANFGINVSFPAINNQVTYSFDIFYNPSGSSTSSSVASQIQSFRSAGSVLSKTLVFNVSSSGRDYNPGDQIRFHLRQYGVTGSQFLTASLAATGKNTPYDGLRNSLYSSGVYPFATGSSTPFISGSNAVDTLVFNSSLSTYVDYLYIPATSSVLLHPIYGNVLNTFSPKVGDVILIYYNGTQYQELNISNVSNDINNLLNVKVTPNLVNFLATGSYTNNTVNQFLLLSKQSDETNINISFDKQDGQTSYGFIIPSNLSPSVLDNIDTITRQVQQKLLNTQQGITINTV